MNNVKSVELKKGWYIAKWSALAWLETILKNSCDSNRDYRLTKSCRNQCVFDPIGEELFTDRYPAVSFARVVVGSIRPATTPRNYLYGFCNYE